MSRSLLYIKLKINNQDFFVSTVHLESLNNEIIRKKQMETCFTEMEEFQNCIFMGDFNFDNEIEDSRIPNNFSDIWKSLKSNDD